MTKLKPCPFCGSENIIVEPHYGESYVRCSHCNAEGPSDDYCTCQELWNNRPAEQELRKIIDRQSTRNIIDDTLGGDITGFTES